MSVAARTAFTTGGPIVMLGTKWPSITSTWTHSAAEMSATSSASRPKSDARMLGAMIGGLGAAGAAEDTGVKDDRTDAGRQVPLPSERLNANGG